MGFICWYCCLFNIVTWFYLIALIECSSLVCYHRNIFGYLFRSLRDKPNVLWFDESRRLQTKHIYLHPSDKFEEEEEETKTINNTTIKRWSKPLWARTHTDTHAKRYLFFFFLLNIYVCTMCKFGMNSIFVSFFKLSNRSACVCLYGIFFLFCLLNSWGMMPLGSAACSECERNSVFFSHEHK